MMSYPAKVCIIIILISLISPVGFAQQHYIDSFFTDGKANGGYWNRLTIDEKRATIAGITQGVILSAEAEIAYLSINKDNATIDDILKPLSSLTPTDVTIDEIVSSLDKFYTDSSNLGIPITSAYMKIVVKCKKD